MKTPSTSDRDTLLVGQVAAAISIASFFYYLRHNDLLLYGDAVAHINIARRVFDSRTPGLLQLGTVWLPLPHVLMLPFLLSRSMWQSGIGGSIPSLLAYVLSVIGIFRLVNVLFPSSGTASSRFAALLAAAVFALNPNLIYLQTTAMTEPVYLAFFIWALVFFCRGIRNCTAGEEKRANGSLVKCGFCIAAASLTRYDGWFVGAVLVILTFLLAWIGKFHALRLGAWKLVLLAAVSPALWLGYNDAVYGNPLEFANGPYSAKAIEQKTSVPGTPPHPGAESPREAFHYFFKSAELNVAAGKLQIFWVITLLLGSAITLFFQRKLWPALLLWIPVPFYVLSIAYGGIPIFVPVWWPFSYYNARYGVELLPGFAVFTAIAAYGLMRFASAKKTRVAIGSAFVILIAASYVQVFRSGPVSFEEAVINSRTRIALEKQLASIFVRLPSDATYLMYLGDHVGAFQQAGISLSHVINEGNHRPWERPSDPEGLWERALADPAKYADFVISFDSDAVAKSINKGELASFLVIHVTGQPPATIYSTLKSNQPR